MELVLRTAIEDVLKDLELPEADFVIEHPADMSHGDYACNVAMVLSKQVGKAAREIAEEGPPAPKKKTQHTEKIEIAGPGFLNFYLHRDFFSQEIIRSTSLGDDWGKNDEWKGKTVIVEYTDPNPFKELHIGHLVPNALGESLSRLFEFSNANTKRVTFQGDVGMHVAKCIWGLQKSGVTPDSMTESDIGRSYAEGATAFEADEKVKEEIRVLNKKIYNKDPEIIELYNKGKEVSLQYFEKAYEILGSDFERNYFFESETGPVGLELVKAHIGDVFEESDGAVIFRGEDYGLHTRVFINAEGLPTYETKDVGLIKCKHDWQPFDLAITVTGTEQEEYFKVTTKASELIQPELAGKVELVPNGMLRLSTGKMSSRTGDVVTALSLIGQVSGVAKNRMDEKLKTDTIGLAEDIAVAAIKYTILKIAAGKDIVFDLEKSISFEGDSGPYLQYTHARICSVLEKAKEVEVVPNIAVAPDEVYEVEKWLYQFPEVVEEALAERAPHLVAVYLTKLAGSFNSFYAAEKIADSNDKYAWYKAAVADAVRQTLKNGLWVLGVKAPEKM